MSWFTVESLEQIKVRLEDVVPGARVAIVRNESPSAQHALLLDREHALACAEFLKRDPQLRLDYASNVTGIDWLDAVMKEKVRSKISVDGVEREVEETVERTRPGCLEVVYHLYSIALGHGPVIIRLRTEDRAEKVHLPSLTPVWRGAEFQEREVYDLYGVIFDGHPDLRRILLWDEFEGHPMRKDYVEPDDYEWEPTPHDDVLARAKRHWNPEVKP
jgi:NADH-quinone oxidoreductase subunit C